MTTSHPEKKDFAFVTLEGRRIYLCGFQHGIGMIKPGAAPIAATARLFSREAPFVLIEGAKSAKKLAKILRHKKLAEGQPIETVFRKALRDKKTQHQLRELIGLDAVGKLKREVLLFKLASPLFVFNGRVRRNMEQVYSGLSQDALQGHGAKIRYDAGRILSREATEDEKFDIFVRTFRSFLMAQAIIEKHEALPKGVPIALFTSSYHSPQVAAFLHNPQLVQEYADSLPPVLKHLAEISRGAKVKRHA